MTLNAQCGYLCSLEIDDIKVLVTCTNCDKVDHNKCLKTDLKTFQKKRVTWNCPDCSHLGIMSESLDSRQSHQLENVVA